MPQRILTAPLLPSSPAWQEEALGLLSGHFFRLSNFNRACPKSSRFSTLVTSNSMPPASPSSRIKTSVLKGSEVTMVGSELFLDLILIFAYHRRLQLN